MDSAWLFKGAPEWGLSHRGPCPPCDHTFLLFVLSFASAPLHVHSRFSRILTRLVDERSFYKVSVIPRFVDAARLVRRGDVFAGRCATL